MAGQQHKRVMQIWPTFAHSGPPGQCVMTEQIANETHVDWFRAF